MERLKKKPNKHVVRSQSVNSFKRIFQFSRFQWLATYALFFPYFVCHINVTIIFSILYEGKKHENNTLNSLGDIKYNLIHICLEIMCAVFGKSYFQVSVYSITALNYELPPLVKHSKWLERLVNEWNTQFSMITFFV